MTVLDGGVTGMRWDPAPITRYLAVHDLADSELTGPQAAPTDAEWARLTPRIEHERLSGMLSAAIDSDLLPATDSQRAWVMDRHATATAVCLRLEQQLLRVHTRFADAGIESRVLKGPTFAHLYYARPELRLFGDIDILVRSTDFAAAAALLEHSGGERRYPEPRRGYDRRFTKGAAFLLPSGLEIDLHRTLAAGPYGLLLDPDDLFETETPLVLAGRKLAALGAEEQLLHACLHARLGNRPPRAMALRDIVEAARNRTLDVARVHDIATRWHVSAVVADALREAWADLQMRTASPLIDWAQSREIEHRDRRRLAAYVNDETGSARKAIAALRDVRGLRAKAAYALAIAFPKRDPRRHATSTRLRRGVDALAHKRGR